MSSEPAAAEPDRSWLPTSATVGALLSSRFGPPGPTSTSRPSVLQVEELLRMVTASTLAATDEPPAGLTELARTTIALGVASMIENSFFPEQGEANDGSAEFFRRRYFEHVETLRERIVTANRVQVRPTT